MRLCIAVGEANGVIGSGVRPTGALTALHAHDRPHDLVATHHLVTTVSPLHSPIALFGPL